ncbi:MAG: AMP-binding protein [Cyclobacteriaceae bacterium]|nr:AMP-binding protein [Cyclobacteriaceae bacterium]MCH8516415.1 AMP-binding protein [Cyclobacteriaceae bacterium]
MNSQVFFDQVGVSTVLSICDNLDHYINEYPDFEYELRFISDWVNGKNFFSFSTSGSTGKAKKVVIARQIIETSALNTINYLKLSSDYLAFVCIPTEKIGGSMMLVRALIADMDIYLQKPSANPFLTSSFLDNYMILSATVPYQVQNLIEKKKYEAWFYSEKLVNIIGAAALSNATIKELKRLNSTHYQAFGMTETVSHIALAAISSTQLVYESTGDHIFDTTPDGRLKVKGNITENKWLESNDIVECIDNTHFIWKGRADLVINSGGFKVMPDQIEHYLVTQLENKLGWTPQIVITSIPDPKLSEKLVLVYTEDDRLKPDIFQTINYKKYQKPFHFIQLSDLPMLSGQKVDRSKIREIVVEKLLM